MNSPSSPQPPHLSSPVLLPEWAQESGVKEAGSCRHDSTSPFLKGTQTRSVQSKMSNTKGTPFPRKQQAESTSSPSATWHCCRRLRTPPPAPPPESATAASPVQDSASCTRPRWLWVEKNNCWLLVPAQAGSLLGCSVGQSLSLHLISALREETAISLDFKHNDLALCQSGVQ